MIKKIEDCDLYGQFIFGEIKEQYKGVMPFRKFFDSHNKDVDEIVDDILDEYGYRNIRTEQLVAYIGVFGQQCRSCTGHFCNEIF